MPKHLLNQCLGHNLFGPGLGNEADIVRASGATVQRSNHVATSVCRTEGPCPFGETAILLKHMIHDNRQTASPHDDAIPAAIFCHTLASNASFYPVTNKVGCYRLPSKYLAELIKRLGQRHERSGNQNLNAKPLVKARKPMC